MQNRLEVRWQRWAVRIMSAPLGLALLLMPASAMLPLLLAIYSEDAPDAATSPLQRFISRLGKISIASVLAVCVLAGELILPAALAWLLPRLFTLSISPWLLVPLGVYLEDMVVLFAIGKVPLGYNVRNLSVRWLTTAMTALAFTLVIGLLTVLLGFVNGMDRLTENSGQPGNVIVMSDGATDELFSTLADGDMSDVERQPGVLRESDLDDRARGPDEPDRRLASKEVYLVVNQPIPPDEGDAPLLQTKGTIKSVALGKEGFVLADDKRNDLVFRRADNCKILINNSAAAFEQLRLGDMVWLAYEKRGEELWATEVHGNNRRRFVQVRGIEDGVIAGKVHGLPLLPGGKWFSSAGVQELPAAESASGKGSQLPAIQAVLGEGVARELARDYKKDRLEIGDVFELGPRRWIVVGVMQSAGSTFGSEIWAKRGVVGPLFGKFPSFSALVLRAKDADRAKDLAEYLTRDYKKVTLNAQPETEYYSKLSGTNRQFSIAIYFVTIIMAIGGVFGVMNTMFAAISQRTKDIGVMRIVGFQRWQILVSFLLESLVIGLVGGVLGAGLAYLLFDGVTATSIVSSGQNSGKMVVLKLTVTLATVGIGALLTLGMGRIGGMLPALAAMRLKPLESMR